MSDSTRNTVRDLAPPNAGAAASRHRACEGSSLVADPQDALCWEMALARAETSADAPARGAPSGATEMGATGISALLGGPTQAGDGTGGVPSQPALSAQAQPEAATDLAHIDGEHAAQPMDADGGVGVATGRGGTRTQEEFLAYKMRRIALGLEPLATSAGMATAPMAEPLGGANTGSLARPVSLHTPNSVTLAALPVADRPVANGLSVGELAVERVVQVQRGEQQVQFHVAEQITHQLHLDAVNTPESLPLQTLKAV